MSSCFIQIDKPFYFAGDTVYGHVFINLLESINANEVMIKFKGWESVRWLQERVVPETERERIQSGMVWHNKFFVRMDSSDSSDNEKGEEESMKYNYVMDRGQLKEIKRYNGGRIIAKFQTVLHNFGGSYIPAGQYSFPFSFKTGEHYPASYMDKSKDAKRKGRIKYEMQVFVRAFNSRIRIIKHKQEIIVRETQAIKNEKQAIQAHVKSCCCIDQGVSKIQCFFEKNAYSPGEEAKIYCMLDTKESQADVTEVTVKLMNQITYTSRENHKKVFSDVIFQRNFPGLDKGLDIQREQIVKIINSKPSHDAFDIKPTARGQRLHSVYYLRVQAVLSASCTCCSDLPVVNQPILLYPYIPVNYHFNAPQSWHPEQLPMINLQVAMDHGNKMLQEMNNPYY